MECSAQKMVPGDCSVELGTEREELPQVGRESSQPPHRSDEAAKYSQLLAKRRRESEVTSPGDQCPGRQSLSMNPSH